MVPTANGFATSLHSVDMNRSRWFVALLTAIWILTACGAQGAAAPDNADADADTSEVETEAAPDELSSEGSEEVAPSVPTDTTPPPLTATEVTAALGSGMNFGNSLEAPREGEWGVGLDEEYFRIVAEAGFDHVRLPVSWADYADLEAPYTIPDGIDPAISGQPYSNIWERVDWAIEQAQANDLMIIVNMHHYDAAHADPLAHRDRISAMWEQIAARYADAGNHVVFELFNEPHAEFTAEPQLWNDLLADLLTVVRETNPTRPVLVGPVGFNSIDFLDDLVLPDDDYLISTVHLYEPFAFTHQGATWVEPTPDLGVSWAPDNFGLADGLSNSSWDTELSVDGTEFRLDFARQWAGFAAVYDEPVEPTELSFDATGVGSLRIGCRTGNTNQLDGEQVDVATETQSFTIDLSECPDSPTGFFLQNSHPNSAPLLLSNLVLCTTEGGCESVVSTADAELRGLVQRAAEWSEQTSVPIHIGEFGAYDGAGEVPLEDRAAWTATVVDEANSLGIPFSYWEFHSSFAAYDLEANEWIEPLREALLG